MHLTSESLFHKVINLHKKYSWESPAAIAGDPGQSLGQAGQNPMCWCVCVSFSSGKSDTLGIFR